MDNIYEFKGYRPVIDESSYIHSTATIIGDVIIGKKVYVGPGAVIRGDWGRVIIEDGCNVQENCVIHMFPGTTVYLRKGAHIGHGAIIHGANIGENCLVGMNAVVMDEVELGSGCIVGALAFVPTKMKVPNRKLVVGNPAVVKKDITDKMIGWKTKGTALYQELPGELFDELKKVEPLREVPKFLKKREHDYGIWEG